MSQVHSRRQKEKKKEKRERRERKKESMKKMIHKKKSSQCKRNIYLPASIHAHMLLFQVDKGKFSDNPTFLKICVLVQGDSIG